MDRRLSSLLGLSRRAGLLCSGETACERAIRAKKALLVIVCGDASDNTKKKFSQKAFYYNVPYREAFTKEELGRAIGKNPCAAIVITDAGFSGRIMELIGNKSGID